MTKLERELQEGLYDPASKKRIALNKLKAKAKARAKHTKYHDPAPAKSMKKSTIGKSNMRIPKRWFLAMVKGINKRSDVKNAGQIVSNIWKRLTPATQAKFRAREAKGEAFKYDLPLPKDFPTKGTGTVRVVEPFNLGEVQVNVSKSDYDHLKSTGEFDIMERNDKSLCLVKRCKSDKGNVNMFVDKV